MAVVNCMTPFHSMLELKQTAQPKNLTAQMDIQKWTERIAKYAYRKLTNFFNCRTTTLWETLKKWYSQLPAWCSA